MDSLLKKDGRFTVFRAPGAAHYNPDELRIKPEYGNAWDAFGIELQYY
jgi:hypothetical protein